MYLNRKTQYNSLSQTYCYFDKKDFQQRLGVDLKTSFIKEQYFGPMAKEIIIDSKGIKYKLA